MKNLPALLLLLGCVLGGSARAWPVDLKVAVPEGGEIFRKLSSIDGVESADPKIALAEVLPTGELMISGVAAGRTLLLLHAEGRMAVWRLEVLPSGRAHPVESPRRELPSEVKKVCRGARISDGRLTAQVETGVCRDALLAWMKQDPFLAGELDLTFSLEALQLQLAAIEQRLKEKKLVLAARYLGAGLVLEGELNTEAQRKSALWIAFEESLGRVPLDDRMRIPATDAGR